MPPTLDASQSISWLTCLEPEGPWLLVAINPNVREEDKERAALGEFAITETQNLIEWLTRYNGTRQWNVYYTSNCPTHSPFRTAKKDTVQSLRILHVDLDLPGAANDKTEIDGLLDRLRALDPPPTAIVFTGGGGQAVWRLDEKLPASEYIERVERVNTAIWRAVGGDHCHDVSRLLRLPGTVNYPNAKKRERGRIPSLAYVVEQDWTRTWSFKRDAVPRCPDRALPSEEEEAHRSTPTFESLPAALRKLIKSGDATQFRDDRSRLGWYVMCELMRRGWSDDDINDLLHNQSYGVASHYLEQPKPDIYITRNIARAREATAKDWHRDKHGQILTRDQYNIDKFIEQLGLALSYDQMADRSWVNGTGAKRQLTDSEVDALWLKAQNDYGFLPEHEFFRTVLQVRARERGYHPVLEYLARVQGQWDGEHRIGGVKNIQGDEDAVGWLSTYGNAEDTPYTRAVGRLTLVAAVRRVRQPGCKFDEILMLVDPTEGSNKSTAVQTLAVKEDWFHNHLPIGEQGRQVIEAIRGFWIIEAQEMNGISTREMTRIKAFCSTQHDRGRMSYDRIVSDIPRACVFIGTTNEQHLFVDIDNRRFWPVPTNGFNIELMRQDLDQLWAEAAVAEAQGESIRLHPSLYKDAHEMQSAHRQEEPWTIVLENALGEMPGRITSPDCFRIINKGSGHIQSADGKRLGRAMRELGFEHKQMRGGGSSRLRWYYYRGDGDDYRKDIYVFIDPVNNNAVYCSYSPDEIPEPQSPF